jgi:hypothetical protein
VAGHDDDDGVTAGHEPPVSSAALAGLLLIARTHLAALGLPAPSRAAIFAATGAGHSRAYECRTALFHALHAQSARPGRPAAGDPEREHAVRAELLEFLLQNPGAVYVHGERHVYGPELRRFVRALHARRPTMSVAALARATRIPAATLGAWLATGAEPAPAAEPAAPAAPAAPAEPTEPPGPAASVPATLAPLIHAWQGWRGTFSAFCRHVQARLGMKDGRDALARLLDRLGVRPIRGRRRGADPRLAPRQAFETFFPGAQWVGDGAIVSVELNGERFPFNLELMVDAASGALVGASIRATESGSAVAQAFHDGVVTTGAPPLGLLLDNRPCNRSPHTVARLDRRTQVVYAARGRPQSKGHVEGAFGLFAQQAPRLAIDARTLGELARQVLALIVTTWTRTLNHRPRRRRKGRSRVELYHQATPTAEERQRATMALARRRRHGPRGPAVTPPEQHAADALVGRGLARLGICAPDAHLRAALVRCPLAAIATGMAMYQGKLEAGTLPPMPATEQSGRYLLALIRAAARELEGLAMARALLGWQEQARTCLHAAWQARHAVIVGHVDGAAAAPGPAGRPGTRDAPARIIDALIDQAVAAAGRLERCFWARAAAQAIGDHGPDRRAALYDRACRRIQGARDLPQALRRELVTLLATDLAPPA